MYNMTLFLTPSKDTALEYIGLRKIIKYSVYFRVVTMPSAEDFLLFFIHICAWI